MIGKGYQENVTVDEGTNAYGYRTQLHFEGDSLITQRTYDAEPLLNRARMMRDATDGTNWGEGQFVGTLPMHEAIRITAIRDDKERQKAIRLFFQENPAFCGNAKYLRQPRKG